MYLQLCVGRATSMFKIQQGQTAYRGEREASYVDIELNLTSVKLVIICYYYVK